MHGNLNAWNLKLSCEMVCGWGQSEEWAVEEEVRMTYKDIAER